MDRRTKLVFTFVTVALAALFFLHRDLSVTLGNSEWDYVANKINGGDGTLDRAGSFREALRPNPFYGQGYAVLIWGIRSGAGCFGLLLDPFRAAQAVTFAFSFALLFAALRLGRCFEIRSDLAWLPVAALSCAWTFLNLSVQVNTDVAASALVALAMVPMVRTPSPIGGAVAGILLSLGFWIRINVAAYPALFAAIALLAPSEPVPFRRRAAFALSIVGGFLAGAAPRFAADYLQTGSLIYHHYGRYFLAFASGVGAEAARPEHISTLEALRQEPALFESAFARSYLYYQSLLLPLLLLPSLLLVRDPALRRRSLVALLLSLGLPLGPSVAPFPATRYILPLFPLAAAMWTAALDRKLRPRLPKQSPLVLAGALSLLFLFELMLLIDKYRFELPEREIATALAAAGNHKPSVLIRPGVPGDEETYHWAVRYRLRRIKARFILASSPITMNKLRVMAIPAPFFVLRVPISDTGPSVVFDWLWGRSRQVYQPDLDPVLGRAQLVVHDPVSGVELHRIDEF